MQKVNLTNEIFELSCPYSNPYQGNDKKLLFVCSAGLLRSATAANLFAKKGFNTRNCGTHEYALIPLSANLIYWADQIYFVNESNLRQAILTFKEYGHLLDMIEKKSITLDIPDQFPYNHPELVRILEEKIKP
jgi:predicted protein tyrosine phosphatase